MINTTDGERGSLAFEVDASAGKVVLQVEPGILPSLLLGLHSAILCASVTDPPEPIATNRVYCIQRGARVWVR